MLAEHVDSVPTSGMRRNGATALGLSVPFCPRADGGGRVWTSQGWVNSSLLAEGCSVILPRKCHVGKPAPAQLALCLPRHRASWCCTRDPASGQLSCPPGRRAPALWSPGYSRQNLRKSDCSSLRAFRNILPFSVPTTKALSSCTATQATSAFSLESAEHCVGSRDVSSGKGPPLWTPPGPALGG